MFTSQFLTAYDTLACRGLVLTKLIESLKRAEIDDCIVPLSNLKDGNGKVPDIALESNIYYVLPSRAGALVPAFVHPITFKSDRFGREITVVDVRSVTRFDERTWETVIKNIIDFKSIALYGRLTDLWQSPEGRRKARDIAFYHITVFTSWISESVARRFALNPKEQMDLMILAGIYYYGLFSDDGAFTERETNNLVSTVSKATRVKPQDVFDLIDGNGLELPIKGAIDFCKLTKEVTGSIRLEEFAEGAGTLFTIVGSTWFGAHAREITGVALEYPPAFIAVIATAMSERTYKNAPIARITDRLKEAEKKSFFGSLTYALSMPDQ
jgi:hypothetical protein